MWLPPFTAAAYLLVSLIPSNSFRQMFRSTRSLHLPTRELPLSPDTTVVLHQVYNLLLGLLGRAKLYVDASVHGTTKLVQYFSFMTYCLISKTEKLMFSGYFMDLWNLFQVSLSPFLPSRLLSLMSVFVFVLFFFLFFLYSFDEYNLHKCDCCCQSWYLILIFAFILNLNCNF